MKNSKMQNRSFRRVSCPSFRDDFTAQLLRSHPEDDFELGNERPMMQIMREHSADGRDILDIASHSAPDFQMDKNSRNARTDAKTFFTMLKGMQRFADPAISGHIKTLETMCERMCLQSPCSVIRNPKLVSKIIDEFDSATDKIIFFFRTRPLAEILLFKELQETIMWIVRRLRICLCGISYYAAFLNEPEELVTGISAIPKSLRQLGILDSEKLLDCYETTYRLLHGKNEKQEFTRLLGNHPLIKVHFAGFQTFKSHRDEYLSQVLLSLKKFKHDEDTMVSVPRLVCRICDEKIQLNHFLIHTELCMKRWEHRKQFKRVDEELLDYGEELTSTIKKLSGKVMKEDLRSKELGSIVRQPKSSVLNKYAMNMSMTQPCSSKASPMATQKAWNKQSASPHRIRLAATRLTETMQPTAEGSDTKCTVSHGTIIEVRHMPESQATKAHSHRKSPRRPRNSKGKSTIVLTRNQDVLHRSTQQALSKFAQLRTDKTVLVSLEPEHAKRKHSDEPEKEKSRIQELQDTMVRRLSCNGKVHVLTECKTMTAKLEAQLKKREIETKASARRGSLCTNPVDLGPMHKTIMCLLQMQQKSDTGKVSEVAPESKRAEAEEQPKEIKRKGEGKAEVVSSDSSSDSESAGPESEPETSTKEKPAEDLNIKLFAHLTTRGGYRKSAMPHPSDQKSKGLARRSVLVTSHPISIKSNSKEPKPRSIAKEEILALDKLRGISRAVYAVDFSCAASSTQPCINCQIDVAQTRKLLLDTQACGRSFYNKDGNIPELIGKLVATIEKKMRLISDLAIVSHGIAVLNHKGRTADLLKLVPMLRLGEQNLGEAEQPLPKAPRTPNLRSTGTLSGPKRPLADEDCKEDLRKMVLMNSFNIQRAFRSNSVVRPPLNLSLMSDSGSNSDHSPSQPASSPSRLGRHSGSSSGSGVARSSRDSVCSTFSAAFFADFQHAHCYSPELPHRKPFDRTEGEEQIDAIFKQSLQPRRRVQSSELNRRSEGSSGGKDERLHRSCTLDYAMENTYFREPRRQVRHSSAKRVCHGGDGGDNSDGTTRAKSYQNPSS